MKNATTNELYSAGDTMKRPKLARTLEIIAEHGADAFYTGQLADKIVREVQSRGGIITKRDLAEYQVDYQEALSVSLNSSLTAFTTHAPTSGPLLTFMLNILRGYTVHPHDLNHSNTSALFYHRLIETFKFAYAKRSELSDPLAVNITEVVASSTVSVPILACFQLLRNLTSKDYADSVRSRIE